MLRPRQRLLLYLVLIAAAGWRFATPVHAAPFPAWPQAGADVPADPSVKFGVLANGMRWAVMRNATPGGQTALRLRIGSGSLEESDAQQGLAHVLEHMAFKGSTHVPPGEMVKTLEREGLAFGADTNAETEWTQTVYQFDLPRSDHASLETGLMLMREIAGELSLAPDALTPERGVVLSEERLRDTPSYRAEKAEIDFMADGQRITGRFPIGQVDVVEHAPAALLRAFYRANYRPDRAVFVAVGDFDPEVMEARIKALFSDWSPAGPPSADPDLGVPRARGLTGKAVEIPGASTQTVIAWVQPHDATPDSLARRRRDIVENLALAVLNRRLEILTRAADPPFISAEAASDDLLHSDKVSDVEATASPGGWRAAIDAEEHEIRRLTQFGVTRLELAREIAEQRATLANAAAGAGTRRSSVLANDIVSTVDDDEVFASPAENLDLFDRAVQGLSVDEVDAAARRVFSGQGPLVAVVSPQALEGGDAAVAAEFSRARAQPLSASPDSAGVTWPYADFGKPGVVRERRDIADLGAVAVRFANGVRLIVKPTHLGKDQVLVSVNVGAGRLGMPKDRVLAGWASAGFTSGGFGKTSLEDAQRALAGKILGWRFGLGDQAFTLSGATNPQDLSVQLQVLTAYVADPGFRPEAFERSRAAYLAALPQLDATADGVLERNLDHMLHAGDPRWTFPDSAQLTAARPDDLRTLLAEPLAHGPVEVTVVGDIGVQAAIDAVAATFGALPARSATATLAPAAREVGFPPPTATPLELNHHGRQDQAIAFVAWPLTGFFPDMRGARAAMLAGEVLQNRILDKIRIAEGATYSPDTEVGFSETFPTFGVAYSLVEMPPAKLPSFFATVSSIVADMKDHGITDDELARVKNPRIAGIEKAQLTNEYWLQRLAGGEADPRRLDLIRTTLPDYAAISAGDVQAAVRRWFNDATAWKLTVEPAAK